MEETATIRRPAIPVIAALVAVTCLMTLACRATSPPEATPARTVTAATLPATGMEPVPTALPAGTPKPRVGLKKAGLEPAYRPVYVVGLEYAAIGGDGQLYIVNVETGEMEQATDDHHAKHEAALSADYVAWTDRRREIELPGAESNPPFNHSADIFILDRATGEEKRITEAPARRTGLEISGKWLVWQDSRNENAQHYSFDIYAYNLKTGEEIPVAIAPGSQRSPAIHGDIVVWADNRNSPVRGTIKVGCGNCPENRFDIYAMNLATGEERILVETGYLNQGPDILGNRLAWQSFDPERPAEVRLLDLETGQTQVIAQNEDFWLKPSLSDRYLVWSVSGNCDMKMEGDFEFTGVFAMRLDDGETWKLTDYVEPMVFISGNMAVIQEYCWGGGPVYAVFLE